MESQAPRTTSPRSVHRSIEQILVRANGCLFHCVAGAALLEGIAPLYAQRLLRFLRDDDLLSVWIRGNWLRRKAARAEALRSYIERTWPEFDWHTAFEEYRAAASADGGLGPHRPSVAHELLARCVAAAQSGVFYRCLARWADDPVLREMARGYAADEARSFRCFRMASIRCHRVRPLGWIASWCTAVGCVRATRDTHLPLAFRVISAQHGPHVPYQHLDYEEFVVRMTRVMERHAHLDTPERLLLRSWKSRPRLARVEQNRHRMPDWFKPLFKAAA